MNNGNIKYTYTNTHLAVRRRIDKVIMDKYLVKQTINYKIVPNVFSDHEGISLILKWGNMTKWGKGIWNMNVSLLNDKSLQEIVLDTIEVFKLNKNRNIQNLFEEWDTFKCNIKRECLAYSIKKQKGKKDEDFGSTRQSIHTYHV